MLPVGVDVNSHLYRSDGSVLAGDRDTVTTVGTPGFDGDDDMVATGPVFAVMVKDLVSVFPPGSVTFSVRVYVVPPDAAVFGVKVGVALVGFVSVAPVEGLVMLQR